jgi:lysyl-tRNA synthetase
MDDENSLIKQRREKLEALRAKGIDPFQNKFTPTEKCNDAREKYQRGEYSDATIISVAGRITAHRDMGKSMFIDVRDQSGRIQCYAQKNILGDEQFGIFTHLDLGDFVGVKGNLFTTKTGEISIKLDSFVILAKALRPPPAKWHGLEDTEIRYRQRYLDLMANPDVKETFLKRSAIVHEIRNFFHARGYVEVETPAMQAIPGGAAAQPFKTFHNALGCDFYLRIALELYHKRLLVGGIDKLFEIGKNFRNEGLSRRHNPEFTMLEAYQAFGDYATMMEIVESLIKHVAQKVLGKLQLPCERPKEVEFQIKMAIDGLAHFRQTQIESMSQADLRQKWIKQIDEVINELRFYCEKTSIAPSSAAAKQARTALEKIGSSFITDYKSDGIQSLDSLIRVVNFSGEVAKLVQRFGPLCVENIDLNHWERVRYKDKIKEFAGKNWFELNLTQQLIFAENILGVDVAGRPRRKLEQNLPRIELDLKWAHLKGDSTTVANLSADMSKRQEYFAHGVESFEATQAVFEEMIEPTLIQPTFVMHLPKELVPLAKISSDDPSCVEVFECCINGQEIAPGYTEQNDPIEQRERLEHQAGGEQQKLDEDFLIALEHGMPPAGGIGIGIDRLCMMLLGQESIRDVILFPQLKPK